MSDTDGGRVELPADPETRVQFLVERDVLSDGRDGVTTTPEFEDVRGIYRDSYSDVDDEGFRDTIADVFGLDAKDAADRIRELDVTREELVAYLALQSYLDIALSRQELALLAAIVVAVEGGSPVPEQLPALTDDGYAAFIDEHGDVVVLVLMHGCDPCEAMKGDLDAVLAEVPDGVAVVGVDGGSVDAFRREFGIEVAPTTLLFSDGELAKLDKGRRRPAQLAASFESVYGDAG